MNRSLFVILTGVFAVVACLAASALTKQDLDPSQKAKGGGLFEGIKTVVIYIEQPAFDYREAVRCHGIENQCVDALVANKYNGQTKEAHLSRLTTDYAEYPLTLQVPNLQRALESFVRNQTKFPNTPVVLHSKKRVEPYSDQYDVLIIGASVRRFVNTTPHIVLFQLWLFRANRKLPVILTIPIPLDLDQTEIDKRVASLIRGLATTTAHKIF